MKRKEYSAGMVKLSFWFSEFRKMIQLLNSGKSMDAIRILSIEENIFATPTTARAIQIFNTVSARIKSLDVAFYDIFERSDVATQKIIVLISIMNVDSLFFDFMYEVYRDKLIIGNNILTDTDIRVFFKNKQVQSEKVAGWTDYTLKRLGACYKTLIMEAGITSRTQGDRELLKPIVDKAFEYCLKEHGMELYVRVLTGVI